MKPWTRDHYSSREPARRRSIISGESTCSMLFYISEPHTQVTVDVTNTTPRTSGQSFVNGGLDTSGGKQLVGLDDGFFGLAEGESGQLAYSFKPGRYLIRFQEGFQADPGAKSYRFTVAGALADEATMNARCEAARDRLRAARKALKRARRKLERVRDHGSAGAVKKARKRVAAAKKEKRRAKRAVRGYCVTG